MQTLSNLGLRSKKIMSPIYTREKVGYLEQILWQSVAWRTAL